MTVHVVYSGVLEWDDHRSFVYRLFDDVRELGRIEVVLSKRGGRGLRDLADKRLVVILRGALADIEAA